MPVAASAPEDAPDGESDSLPSLSPDLISRTARDVGGTDTSSDLLFSKGAAATTRWRSYDHKDNFEPAQAATAPPTDADELGSWFKYDGAPPAPADQAKSLSDDEHPTSWFKYETKPVASLLGRIEKRRSKTRVHLPKAAPHAPAASLVPAADAPGPDEQPNPGVPESAAKALETLPPAEPAVADTAVPSAPEPDAHAGLIAAEPTVVLEEPTVPMVAPSPAGTGIADAMVPHDLEPDFPARSVTSEPTIALVEPTIAGEAATSAETTGAGTAVKLAREPDPQTETVATDPTAVGGEVASGEATAAPLETPLATTEHSTEDQPVAVEEAAAAESLEPSLAAAGADETVVSEPSEAEDARSTEVATPPSDDLLVFNTAFEQQLAEAVARSEAREAKTEQSRVDEVQVPAEVPEFTQSTPVVETRVDAPNVPPATPVPVAEAMPVEAPVTVIEPTIKSAAPGKKAMLARLAAMLEQALSAKRAAPSSPPADASTARPPEPAGPIAAVPINDGSSNIAVDARAAETDATGIAKPWLEEPTFIAEPLPTPPPAEIASWQEDPRQPDAPEAGADMSFDVAVEAEAVPQIEAETAVLLHVNEPQVEPEVPLGLTPEPEALAVDVDVRTVEATQERQVPLPDAAVARTPDRAKKAVLARLAEMLERAISKRPASALSEPPEDVRLELPTPPVVSEVVSPAIEAQVSAPTEALIEPSEMTALVAITEPLTPIASAQEPESLMRVEATPEPDAGVTSRESDAAIVVEAIGAAIETEVDAPMDGAIDALEMSASVTVTEPVDLASPNPAAQESGADVALAATPEAVADIVSWESKNPVVDEATGAAIEAPAVAPVETELEPSEVPLAVAIAEPIDLAMPIAAAEEPESLLPVEATPEPDASVASPASEAPLTNEATGAAIEAEVDEPADGAVAAFEETAAVAEPINLAMPTASTQVAEADVPVEVASEREAIAALPPSAPGLLEIGALEESAAQVVETPPPPSVEALDDSDAAAVHETPTLDATPALEAIDQIAVTTAAGEFVAASDIVAAPPPDASDDAEAAIAPGEPTIEAAVELALPAISPEDAEDTIASDANLSGPIGEEPEIADLVEAPALAASDTVDRESARIVVAAEFPAEPSAAAAALIPTADLDPSPPPAAPPVAAANPPLTPAQQEKAARQALTNDLADVIHSVLSTTQFATKALKPKRYDEVQQPVDQPELSELAEELAASLPYPVVVRSRFGRMERVVAFASIGMMTAVGYFGFSLWHNRDAVSAQAPAIAIVAPPAGDWAERARDMTRDLGATATVTEIPKAPSGGPEAGAPKTSARPQARELAQ